MNSNLDPETQLSLIVKIRDAGDEDAWSEFVQIYQPVVQRFVRRHGLQYADAVEITQEVLSRVAKSIESWDANHQKSTFRGWLYRITRNITIDFLRKKKIERQRMASSDAGLSQVADMGNNDQSQEFEREFEKQVFYWAVEKLKPSFKPANWQAFWMSTIDGVPVIDVAKQLQMTPGNVYVARSRIMSRLSELVQARMAETQS